MALGRQNINRHERERDADHVTPICEEKALEIPIRLAEMGREAPFLKKINEMQSTVIRLRSQ